MRRAQEAQEYATDYIGQYVAEIGIQLSEWVAEMLDKTVGAAEKARSADSSKEATKSKIQLALNRQARIEAVFWVGR